MSSKVPVHLPLLLCPDVSDRLVAVAVFGISLLLYGLTVAPLGRVLGHGGVHCERPYPAGQSSTGDAPLLVGEPHRLASGVRRGRCTGGECRVGGVQCPDGDPHPPHYRRTRVAVARRGSRNGGLDPDPHSARGRNRGRTHPGRNGLLLVQCGRCGSVRLRHVPHSPRVLARAALE